MQIQLLMERQLVIITVMIDRLSTEGGFGGGEKPILAGVLVSGIGLLPLLVSVTGGDMTRSWEEFALCDAYCCAVC